MIAVHLSLNESIRPVRPSRRGEMMRLVDWCRHADQMLFRSLYTTTKGALARQQVQVQLNGVNVSQLASTVKAAAETYFRPENRSVVTVVPQEVA